MIGISLFTIWSLDEVSVSWQKNILYDRDIFIYNMVHQQSKGKTIRNGNRNELQCEFNRNNEFNRNKWNITKNVGDEGSRV